jgi:hypothetical protein
MSSTAPYTSYGIWTIRPRIPTPFRKCEFGLDGRTLYLYGSADTTMEQVNAWIEDIWVGKERNGCIQQTFGEIGTDQFRVMLKLPE